MKTSQHTLEYVKSVRRNPVSDYCKNGHLRTNENTGVTVQLHVVCKDCAKISEKATHAREKQKRAARYEEPMITGEDIRKIDEAYQRIVLDRKSYWVAMDY